MRIMRKVTSVFGILFLVVIVSGCAIPVKSSPAPACSEYWPKSLAPSGGCTSKYAIIDIKMEPQISCLGFDINNCVNPKLYLINHCEEPVHINGNEVSERYPLVLMSGGPYMVSERKGREGESVLSTSVGYNENTKENRDHTLNGIIGYKEFTISFTVTKKLC